MWFLEGALHFTLEVRNENNYGAAAILAKRLDYFEAGILVVQDVDPIEEVVRK